VAISVHTNPFETHVQFLPTTPPNLHPCSCFWQKKKKNHPILSTPPLTITGAKVMGGDIFRLLFLLFFLFHLTNFASAKGNGSSPTTATFSPADNYLINCG
jgi:hypothetical protein